LFWGGTALLLDATKDEKYMQYLKTVMVNFEKVFVRDNIFIDPCEVGGIACKQNQGQFKGPAIYALMHVYDLVSDSEIKNKLKTWIETSAGAMFSTCNSEFSCSNFWLPSTTDRPRDVHNQMNALFISNCLSSIKSATVQDGKRKPAPGEKNSVARVPIEIWSSIFIAAFLF
jgi:hypothetical protein